MLGAVAFWLIGMETRGRTIDEIEGVLARPGPVAATAGEHAAGN